MFNIFKRKFTKGANPPIKSLENIPTDNIPKEVIYRNRFNYGVNFGSFFVLERYIYDRPFSDGGENEHDAIKIKLGRYGEDETATELSNHYENYLTAIDWSWLKNEVGVTAIRLPIGYWHVDNGSFIDSHFVFHDVKEVYSKAKPWEYIKKVVYAAELSNIGILIDLHGLPGGANNDAHSGEGEHGQVKFFNSKENINKVCEEILPFIVREFSSSPNIIGIQIVNESSFSNDGINQKFYYSKAVNEIRKIGCKFPIIISDGWWPDQWSDWVEELNLSNDIIIDTHIYRCFSDSDKSKSAEQIIDELPETVKLNIQKADFMIGEFSCVLDSKTWEKSEGNRNDLVYRFGQKQMEVFKNSSTWGCFFWTYKFEHGDGGEWGYIPMIDRECISKRQKVDLFIDTEKVDMLIQSHIEYWKDRGGEYMEHWRYEAGLKNTLKDMEMFDKFDNSRLGRYHFWKNIRRHQYILEYGNSDFMWEWEQGFDTAIREFNVL